MMTRTTDKVDTPSYSVTSLPLEKTDPTQTGTSAQRQKYYPSTKTHFDWLLEGVVFVLSALIFGMYGYQWLEEASNSWLKNEIAYVIVYMLIAPLSWLSAGMVWTLLRRLLKYVREKSLRP